MMMSMPEPHEEELERLVDEYTRPLLRGALAMGFSESDAEELVQDTFVAFLQGRDRFEGRSSLKTYLFGILYHKGAELSRRRNKEVGVEDIEAVFDARFDKGGHWLSNAPKGPEDAALSDEIARLIALCAEQLSTTQRTAFFLKEVEGESSKEICNVLGVTDTHLRVLLFRARLRLRECLERNWEAK
jgi:RNA polymerase sigma-70 factor (ECF subfamily)